VLTVTSPNTDRTLLTIAELRSAAGVSDGSKDAALKLLGGYVASTITKACRVRTSGAVPPTLRLEGVTETFHYPSRRRAHSDHHRFGEGPWPLALARVPVVELLAVTEGGTVLDPADYEFEPSSGFLFRLSNLCRIEWCHGKIVVDYTAGYDVVPDDLKYAAIKFVRLELLRAVRDPLQKTESIPGVIERQWWVEPRREVGIPPEIMDMLDQGGYVNEVFV
jgi:hypothetical protein